MKYRQVICGVGKREKKKEKKMKSQKVGGFVRMRIER